MGIEIIGDIELFAREIRPDPAAPGLAPVIAITGTNGKSTTTALIGHILAACGFDAQVGGNIGKPALELSPPGPKTVYVLEISSYQIDLSPGFKPDVAILSNITPDHIDRHGSMENYAAVKTKLLKQTAKAGLNHRRRRRSALRCDLHQIVLQWRPALRAGIGRQGSRPRHLRARRRALRRAERPCRQDHGSDRAAHLPGAHNWQNAALAYAATKPYVKDARAIAAAIASFPVSPIASKMSAARQGALRQRFQGHQCRRRRARAGLFRRYFLDRRRQAEGGRHRVSGAAFFPHPQGLSDRRSGARLCRARSKGKVAYRNVAARLENAVAAAAADAAASGAPAPVVLLSPACASFDQFRISSSAATPSAPWSPSFRTAAGGVMSLSRANRSRFADWWWTIDRPALFGDARSCSPSD